MRKRRLGDFKVYLQFKVTQLTTTVLCLLAQDTPTRFKSWVLQPKLGYSMERGADTVTEGVVLTQKVASIEEASELGTSGTLSAGGNVSDIWWADSDAVRAWR